MKYLMWLLNAAIFILLFVFALNNQASITVHLLFGAQWQVPLVLALYVSLLFGVCLGVFLMLPLWLRARKQPAVSTSKAPVAAPSTAVSAVPDTSASASPTL